MLAFTFFFRTFFLVFLFGSTITPLNELRLLVDLCWFLLNLFDDSPGPASFSCPGRFLKVLLGLAEVPRLPACLSCFSFFTDLFTRMDRPCSFEPSSSSASCTESTCCNKQTNRSYKLTFLGFELLQEIKMVELSFNRKLGQASICW